MEGTLRILEDWFYVASGEGESHPDIMKCFHRDLLYYMDRLNEAQRERYCPGENLATIVKVDPVRFFSSYETTARGHNSTVTLRDPK